MTLAECCIGTGIGARVDLQAVPSPDAFAEVATLFGESASRAVVSVDPAREHELLALASREGIPARRIGTAVADRVTIAIDGRTVVDEPLVDVERTWSTAIGSYFEPARAIA